MQSNDIKKILALVKEKTRLALICCINIISAFCSASLTPYLTAKRIVMM